VRDQAGRYWQRTSGWGDDLNARMYAARGEALVLRDLIRQVYEDPSVEVVEFTLGGAQSSPDTAVYAIRSSMGKYLKRGFPRYGRSWVWTSNLWEARLYAKEVHARRQMNTVQGVAGPKDGLGLLSVVEIPLGEPRVVAGSGRDQEGDSLDG